MINGAEMLNEDELKLVLERLKTMPSNLRIAIGDAGSFTKDQLISEVERRSELGELIVEVYMNYFRSFKKSD